jgi:hypothetical protein
MITPTTVGTSPVQETPARLGKMSPEQVRYTALAVRAFAEQILAYEREQVQLHLISLGQDEPCRCNDCRGVPGIYPSEFSVIARRIVEQEVHPEQGRGTAMSDDRTVASIQPPRINSAVPALEAA